MGLLYEWGMNPFQDFLFKSIIFGADIGDEENNEDIYIGFVTILEYFLDDMTNTQYLDFEIKTNGVRHRLIPNNIITALWFMMIFPVNIRNVLAKNEYVVDGIKYKYNPKTKKITY